MKYNEIYQKLREKYSDEEIADSMLIPEDLTEKEMSQINEEVGIYRIERMRNMTEEEAVLSDVMRLRFQIENYIKQEKFEFEKTFGSFLSEYIRILRKDRKDIAEDLAIHYTKLSRITNDKEEPNVEFCYRLEKHSGNLIHATLWWKLIVKKQEFVIRFDQETRKVEQGKVKGFLRAS